MKRTNVNFEPEEHKALLAHKKRTGEGIGELVRRLVRQELKIKSKKERS